MIKNKIMTVLVFLNIALAMIAVLGCNSNEIEGENETGIDETNYVDLEDNQKLIEFNECLAENGMIIYGSRTCPACIELIETLGGYEVAEPVYIECTEERQRCQDEMKGSAVPEIQFNSEAYRGQRTLEGFSEATGCSLP